MEDKRLKDAILELELRLQTEKTLVECIHTLTEGSDSKKALDSLLEIIANFYEGDRAYIFEINEKEQNFSNTYEWCREGISSELESLQKLPLEQLEDRLEQFETKGEFYMERLSEDACRNAAAYHTLERQGIHSLIAAPLISKGRIMGFIGVDNPRNNFEDLLLLTSVTYFVKNDLEKRRTFEILEHLSYYDSLTGVYNRNKYNETLHQLEENSLTNFGIVCMNLNGLKAANDKYGHSYGDIMLRKAGGLLEKVFTNGIYRIGGDEFTVFCYNITSAEFERKVEYLRRWIKHEAAFDAAVGSRWEENASDINVQMIYADKQMCSEKQAFYSHGVPTGYNRRTELVLEVQKEIIEGKYVIYLQPQVELKSGEVNGAEALIRKLDDRDSLIYPDKFVPLYEREGVIRYIDFFVLETICRFQKQCKEEGKRQIRIAVNFSRETLLEHNIVEKLLAVCRKYGVLPGLLEIEVTESMDSIAEAELQQLVFLFREAGFSVALDDFGSKFANLSLLAKATFDTVKFDKALIDLIGERNNHQIIKYSVALCHELNNTATLAEGIETQEQREILCSLGCRYGQGYLFSRPITIDDFKQNYL